MNRSRRFQQTKFGSYNPQGNIQQGHGQQHQQTQQNFNPSPRQQTQFQRSSNNQQSIQQQKFQPKPQRQQREPTPEAEPETEQELIAPSPPKLDVEQEEPEQEPEQEDGNEIEESVSQSQSGDVDDSTELTDKNGKMRFKKIFLVRKKSSVRAREKKIRQNRQLRKAIMPKNALMALNEVKGIEMSDFQFSSNANVGFTAVVTVNNCQYEGRGNSKIVAKNDACEKALRDYVIAKMLRKPRKVKHNSESAAELMDTDDMNDDNISETKNSVCNDDPDDVPMVNLASFALFKLFSEWESAGFVVPEMHPSAPNGEAQGPAAAKEPKKLPVRTELPSNWETMHPATLLCVMRPGVAYSECDPFGEVPNVMQKLCVVVDEQEFYGTGRSKKIARKNAAASVCNTLFGTNFTVENVAETA